MQIVPQYVDIEDKVAGPLTWKHIGWLFAGGVILTVLWQLLDTVTFYIVAIPVGVITAALAFVRPNGVSMVTFLGYGMTYIFRQKTYTWQNEVLKPATKTKEQKAKAAAPQKEQPSAADIAAIATTLDTRGMQRNERIQQIIRERTRRDNT